MAAEGGRRRKDRLREAGGGRGYGWRDAVGRGKLEEEGATEGGLQREGAEEEGKGQMRVRRERESKEKKIVRFF